jgi:hypothetical protein
MKYLWIWLMLSISSLSVAQEMYPKGCAPWVIKTPEVGLSSQQPTVMMLHNISDTDLWITQVLKDNPGVKAGFTSLVEAGKWSALTFSEPTELFTIRCIESKPGHEQPVPCAEVLAVCHWLKTKLPESAKGTFWAAENMDFNPLKAYIERRGFILEIE